MPNYIHRQLKTSVTGIGEITCFNLVQEVNDHGRCTLKGILSEGTGDNAFADIGADEGIRVYLEPETGDANGKSETIFYGIIYHLSIFQEGDFYQFHLELISPTFLLDRKKRSRSFQNKNLPYQQLIETVAKAYDGGATFDSVSDGAAISQLIVQYEETDWEFLKRLASHFNESIYPSSLFDTPKVYFGRRRYLDQGELNAHEYEVHKQIGCNKKAQANDFHKLHPTDAISYQVRSSTYYELSTRLTYQGKTLYVKAYKGELKAGEVIFTYTLSTENGMGQEYRYHEHLCGVSLAGTVLSVSGDKVKVRLSIDDTQDEQTAWEFPYQTMYAAGDSGGWYCMPEPDDQVFICFPGKAESEAVATASSRNGNNRDETVNDPAIKYFRTIHGKEIRFTPEEIVITCLDSVDPDTGEERRVRLVLNENRGITLETSEKISFRSEKGINIEAGEQLLLYASDEIKLRCKKGQIRMDQMIDIAGPDVRIN